MSPCWVFQGIMILGSVGAASWKSPQCSRAEPSRLVTVVPQERRVVRWSWSRPSSREGKVPRAGSPSRHVAWRAAPVYDGGARGRRLGVRLTSWSLVLRFRLAALCIRPLVFLSSSSFSLGFLVLLICRVRQNFLVYRYQTLNPSAWLTFHQ